MTNPPRWLSTLIRLRQQQRDECRRHLDEAQRAADVLDEKAQATQTQIAEVVEMRRRTSASGACDLNLLLSAQRHQAALVIEQRTTAEQTELLKVEIDRRRSVLVAAEQQVRTLEKLAERKRLETRREADRREAKRLDDIGMTMQAREEIL